MKTLPCDEFACSCLGEGHPCACDAETLEDCRCFICSRLGCDYHGPDVHVGPDGYEGPFCREHLPRALHLQHGSGDIVTVYAVPLAGAWTRVEDCEGAVVGTLRGESVSDAEVIAYMRGLWKGLERGERSGRAGLQCDLRRLLDVPDAGGLTAAESRIARVEEDVHSLEVRTHG